MQKQGTGALNVLVVVPAIDREGTTSVVIGQINGFIKRGLTPYLLVIGKFNKEVFQESGCSLPCERILHLGQPYTYLSVRALLMIYSLLKPVSAFMNTHSVQVVIAHAPYAHFLMRLVKLFYGRSGTPFKLLQYFHSLQYAQFPLSKASRNLFNAFNQTLAKKYDDVHISVSEAVRADIEQGLVKHAQHQVLLTPVTAAESDTVLAIECCKDFDSDFTILLPGRLEHNKGQLLFLEVVATLIKTEQLQAKDITVQIAGEGPGREAIQSFILENELSEYVQLAGQLPRPALLHAMQCADLVVIPSFLEGLPMVALEALQVGAMVLASDAGGLKEIVIDGRNGFLFKAGDTADCLQKFKMIYLSRHQTLIDPEFVKRDLKERFSFDNHMRQLLQIIHAA